MHGKSSRHRNETRADDSSLELQKINLLRVLLRYLVRDCLSFKSKSMLLPSALEVGFVQLNSGHSRTLFSAGFFLFRAVCGNHQNVPLVQPTASPEHPEAKASHKGQQREDRRVLAAHFACDAHADASEARE